MGWRGTAGLGIALLAAAAFLYIEIGAEGSGASWRSLFELPRPTPPGADIKHLLDFDPERVTVLRLRRDTLNREMRRAGRDWQGAQSPAAVRDFLRALRGLAEIMPLDVDERELADHGLDPPAAVIEIERDGAPPLALLVGRRNPSATGVYVQLGPRGPVVLTGALLLWELDKFTRSLAAASEAAPP
jgi:hypothetical protein